MVVRPYYPADQEKSGDLTTYTQSMMNAKGFHKGIKCSLKLTRSWRENSSDQIVSVNDRAIGEKASSSIKSILKQMKNSYILVPLFETQIDNCKAWRSSLAIIDGGSRIDHVLLQKNGIVYHISAVYTRTEEDYWSRAFHSLLKRWKPGGERGHTVAPDTSELDSKWVDYRLPGGSTVSLPSGWALVAKNRDFEDYQLLGVKILFELSLDLRPDRYSGDDTVVHIYSIQQKDLPTGDTLVLDDDFLKDIKRVIPQASLGEIVEKDKIRKIKTEEIETNGRLASIETYTCPVIPSMPNQVKSCIVNSAGAAYCLMVMYPKDDEPYWDRMTRAILERWYFPTRMEEGRYHNLDQGFSIEFPRNWDIKERDPLRGEVKAVYHDWLGRLAMVNVTVEPLSSRERNYLLKSSPRQIFDDLQQTIRKKDNVLDDIVTDFAKDYEHLKRDEIEGLLTSSEKELIDCRRTTIGSQYAVYHKIRWSGPLRGRSLEHMSSIYYVPQQKALYTVTGGADWKIYDKYEATLVKSIMSLDLDSPSNFADYAQASTEKYRRPLATSGTPDDVYSSPGRSSLAMILFWITIGNLVLGFVTSYIGKAKGLSPFAFFLLGFFLSLLGLLIALTVQGRRAQSIESLEATRSKITHGSEDTMKRMTRAEYFLFLVVLNVAFFALSFILASLSTDPIAIESLLYLLRIPGIILGLCLIVMRLHDLNYSGWYALLIFLPLANLILLIILLFVRCTLGPNTYGSTTFFGHQYPTFHTSADSDVAADLTVSSEIQAQPADDVYEHTCPNCGSKVVLENNICTNCGAHLSF